MAEWLERWTCNPEAPCSSPALTASWICFTVVPSSDPRPAMLVNSSLVCLRPVGILNPVMFDLSYRFRYLFGPTSISAINTAEGK